MKPNTVVIVTGLTLLASAQWAQAQDGESDATDDGELTMMLITDPEAQLPAAVTNRIELPPTSSVSASQESAELKDENREGAPGLETAAEVNTIGREMFEAARERHENLRGNGLENRPELPNPPPGLPEIPMPNPPGPPGPPSPPGP